MATNQTAPAVASVPKFTNSLDKPKRIKVHNTSLVAVAVPVVELSDLNKVIDEVHIQPQSGAWLDAAHTVPTQFLRRNPEVKISSV